MTTFSRLVAQSMLRLFCSRAALNGRGILAPTLVWSMIRSQTTAQDDLRYQPIFNDCSNLAAAFPSYGWVSPPPVAKVGEDLIAHDQQRWCFRSGVGA